ncbi:rod shape-determining protein MreC [Liquorilactobacillus nagelii]|jgi:rod shape-determining protein MreC|uniref:rod shape-determining protein MreC n=1 Tax=Liquorilactobacillus nagelii TaxID=82688 RepID=UPI0006EF9196|nr:rod shape-determining protein MreC [Liquorilactobacillus nagelii]KRL41414.1 rod shape-determining protein MreC [Liquorilactobacillus nagelii DSM 13675]MCI1700401.1 rod shape-determining protein MreC [Liquorilactobacillus nagelii]QYH54247.1 rod shape-determining protein MreC [Liquorilactobacillus nagelii DSM 13675]ULQ50042.1 rod shape-determining protein MreC [Liquorilactobacillus nagelii]
MQRFFFNKRLVIILITLIIGFSLIAFSIVIRNNRKTPTVVQQVGNSAVGVVNQVVGAPVNGIKAVGDSISELLNTYSENQQLKKQVDSLATEKVRNQTLTSENKKLKTELKLKNSLTDFSLVSASVVSRAPSSWQNQLVINKGSLSGIKKNQAVVSQHGLIGRIVEVSAASSKVELISNDDSSSNQFATQILSDSGNINGLITGYSKSTNLLTMGQITSQKKIKKGDRVITSGLGGNSPEGLYVGRVTKVEKDDYGLASKVFIKPAADLSDLEVVSVAKRTD